MTVCIADLALIYRMTDLGRNFIFSAGNYVLPFIYLLEDIIAEIYSFARVRQVIWSMILGCFIFSSIITIAIHLPAPDFWHHSTDFRYVFAHVFRITIGGGLIALLGGGFINSIILSKWKVLTRGKYFIFRSLGATAIGQAIQNLLGCFLLFTGILSGHRIMEMVIPFYIVQMCVSIILVFPGKFFVLLLKRYESAEVYDTHVTYNPFSFQIGKEEIVKNTKRL